MPKHKAPTEVTVVSTQERQGFGLWVENYWKPALALGLLVGVGIIALQYVRRQQRQAEVTVWHQFNERTEEQLVAQGSISYYLARVGPPAEVQTVARELDSTLVGPWAWASVATSFARDGKYLEASEALGEIRTRHASSFLADTRFRFGQDATPRTLIEQANRSYQDWAAWEAANSALFENPPLQEAAPRVRLRTDQGDIVVGLDRDKAPLHADNFLKLCGEGYYDDTAFHRVIRGFMIQGGDPNSREGDPSTWGQGGPDEGIAAESNDLRHFRGVLAGAKPDPSGDSSGSQFYITVAPSHHLDADYTVFGRVLEGMDVVDAIVEGEIAQNTQDRPKSPVRVLGTEVL